MFIDLKQIRLRFDINTLCLNYKYLNLIHVFNYKIIIVNSQYKPINSNESKYRFYVLAFNLMIISFTQILSLNIYQLPSTRLDAKILINFLFVSDVRRCC